MASVRPELEKDNELISWVVGRLAELPGVAGVALGGSRAPGRHGRGSDWDLGVYTGSGFRVAEVRALVASAGWTGVVADIGEWGEVVNGGAWLDVEGRRVDLLWREVTTIERLIDEC